MPPQIHPTPPQDHRFHLLDGLRGLAAVLVVGAHLPYPFFPQALRAPWLAVDFFFCLSGFVVAFAYEQRLAAGLGVRRFLIARGIRLYPVFVLGVLAGALIMLLPWERAHPFYFFGDWLRPLVFLQLFMMPGFPAHYSLEMFVFDPPAWSIFFEWIANIGFALLVVRGFNGTRPLAVILLLSAVGMVSWIVTGHTLDAGPTMQRSAIVGLFRVAFSFVAGVLVLRLYRRSAQRTLPRVASGAVAAAACAAIVLLLVEPAHLMQTPLFTFFSVVVAFPAIVYGGAFCRLPRALDGICSLAGELSYPVYLLHTSVIAALLWPGLQGVLPRHAVVESLGLPAVVVVTALLSYAVSRWYDIPVRRALTRAANRMQSSASDARPASAMPPATLPEAR